MLTLADFTEYLTSQAWYKPDLRILCACSGGGDSTVLLHLLSHIPGLKLAVFHFNHQLRGRASLRDLEFVRQQAASKQLQFHEITRDVAAYARRHGLSIEEAGSRLRRQAFLKQLNAIHYDYVLTAQHQNDQIETVLMNLMNGTGIRGLAGIRRQSQLIIRPLLPWNRQEILHFAAAHKLEFVTDVTNQDQVYRRNRIRATLLPFIQLHSQGDIFQRISSIQSSSERLFDLIDKYVEDIDNKDIMEVSTNKISLGMGPLTNYFSAIQKAIFDKAFQIISGASQGLSQKHFMALKHLGEQLENGRHIHLPRGIQAIREWQWVSLYRPDDLRWLDIEISAMVDRDVSFFSLKTDYVPLQQYLQNPCFFWLPVTQERLILRPVVRGDDLLTNTGRRIPVRKLLQGARVAPHLRDVFPVLVRKGQEVLWVPGIRTAQGAWLDQENISAGEMRTCLQIRFQKGTMHANTRS